MSNSSEEAAKLLRKYGGWRAASKATGIPESTLRCRVRGKIKPEPLQPQEGVNIEGGKDDCVLTLKSSTIRTLEEALAEGRVDQKIWEVERWVLNKWDCAAKVERETGETLAATELWQVKVWFRRKKPLVLALESVLEQIKSHSFPVPKLHKPTKNNRPHRSLEISVTDLHLGMRCFPPAASSTWGIDEAEQSALRAVHELLELSQPYAPLSEIVFPFGNDYLHADSVAHATTAGTGQPEMDSWHHVYERAAKLAVAMVDAMKQAAPVKVYQIPGNHDRCSSYSLGKFLEAYYRNDRNVTVDASPSPYKFHHFGASLIGFEHGHSIAPIRLAAIMANEQPEAWAKTKYRFWHLGDQHRKGSAKPSAMEEQGVGVEYLPSLNPPNEWHKLKGFSHQQRSSVAFVWDYEQGPVARLQVNLT